MKRGFLAGGAAILVAAALAVPLWLAVDDDGPRRAASLAVAGDDWRLTIQGVNNNEPMPIKSFSWGMRRPAGTGAAQHDALQVTRFADDISSELLSQDATATPAEWARLELLDNVPGKGLQVVWRYDLTKVTVDYSQAAEDVTGPAAERIALRYQTISSSGNKDGALPFGGDVAVMFSNDPVMSSVRIGSLWFGGADVTETGKVSFPPLKITRALDVHAGQLERKALDGKTIGEVRIELRPPSAPERRYAMYELTNVTVVSAASSGAEAGQAVQTLELSPARLKTTSYREDPNTGQFMVSKTFCWDMPTNKAC